MRQAGGTPRSRLPAKNASGSDLYVHIFTSKVSSVRFQRLALCHKLLQCSLLAAWATSACHHTYQNPRRMQVSLQLANGNRRELHFDPSTHTSMRGIVTSYSEDRLVDICRTRLTSTRRVRRNVYSPTLSTGKDALRSQPPATCNEGTQKQQPEKTFAHLSTCPPQSDNERMKCDERSES